MKSVMQHAFSMIPSVNIPRSTFNRSHGYKTTFDAGYLVPFYVDEALPGDTFRARVNLFGRLATPIVPIMDNLFLDTFYFAVPNRLLWDNWQKFNGEQVNPGDSTAYLIPTITSPAGGWTAGSLSDYFGLPTGVAGLETSSLWHRAYNLIYNEWFRDQNLQNSLVVDKDDGPDNPADYVLKRRGKRHDYFTSCLPWPQKGPGVNIPLMGQAPVYGTNRPLGLTIDATDLTPAPNGPYGLTTGLDANNIVNLRYDSFGFNRVMPGNAQFPGNQADGQYMGVISKEQVDANGWGQASTGLYANLDDSTSTVMTINALREAFQLQKMLERDARGGTRYTEIIRSHFGVVSPDARLQRPEYLGGNSVRININPVQQTSSTDATSPQGNLAAFGVVTDSNGGFSKSFTEHCVIIGMACVRADLTYQQGIDRMFSRQTREDFYWPSLAYIGEQPVYNKEIYADGTAADNGVFGYQERYAEYRYFPSKITGKFRSTDPQPLDVWHLSQEFAALPALNSTFISEDPPLDRVIAVPAEPHILFDSYIELQCARPMPTYSVPGFVDHF
ncbi:MAG: major capsid protein [Arizlama microvirus]|nr:MAG: major capsid protein [Arizlama microvirus]